MAGSYFGGRDERYRLSGGTDLVINGSGRSELVSMIADYCHAAADNIADAANATSSWGGYASYYQDNGATVSALSASDGERGRRLLAALGTASEPTLTYTTKAGKTRSATQAQIDNWTRGSR